MMEWLIPLGLSVAFVTVVVIVGMIGKKIGTLFTPRTPRGPGEREPWEEVCISMIEHPEEWSFRNRSNQTGLLINQEYKFHYQCGHKKSGLCFAVVDDRRSSSYDKFKVFHYNDSKATIPLDRAAVKGIYRAFKKALATQLRMEMNPEQVEYRNNEFYCPHCGEKVGADIVIRKEEECQDS